LTVDYLRNIGLHFQVGVDVNHAGDSRYLELNAALNAIAATVAANAAHLFSGQRDAGESLLGDSGLLHRELSRRQHQRFRQQRT
jgi:hypothetical protein